MSPTHATEPYEIVRAQAADWERLAALLEASALPPDGLEPHLDSTLVARDPSGLVGCAALELYGSDALLRSVAVAPARRGTGLGIALTAAAIALARQHHVRTLWLLTETASGFFPKFGFVQTTRDAVPDTIKQSVEFTTACPTSALVMTLSNIECPTRNTE
jgi:amino-acid N-acetyltransferase